MWKTKKLKSPPFVMIYKEMLKHPNWQKMKTSSMVAYLYIKSKSISKNQEEIFLSFKEMEPIMSHPTFFNALTELERHGFIEKVQFGGLYRKRNKFKLVDNWKQTSRKDSLLSLGKIPLPSTPNIIYSSKFSLLVEAEA